MNYLQKIFLHAYLKENILLRLQKWQRFILYFSKTNVPFETWSCISCSKISLNIFSSQLSIFILTRKVFLPAILNLVQIFTGIRQWRMNTKLKILTAEFKRESYKFVFNNHAGFIEMRFYRLLANLMTWNSITSF